MLSATSPPSLAASFGSVVGAADERGRRGGGSGAAGGQTGRRGRHEGGPRETAHTRTATHATTAGGDKL